MRKIQIHNNISVWVHLLLRRWHVNINIYDIVKKVIYGTFEVKFPFQSNETLTSEFCCFRSVPDYFIWIKYTSWFLYSNELMIVNQWRDVNHISKYLLFQMFLDSTGIHWFTNNHKYVAMLVNTYKFFSFFKVVMKQIQLFAFIMGKTLYKVLIMMR